MELVQGSFLGPPPTGIVANPPEGNPLMAPPVQCEVQGVPVTTDSYPTYPAPGVAEASTCSVPCPAWLPDLLLEVGRALGTRNPLIPTFQSNGILLLLELERELEREGRQIPKEYKSMQTSTVYTRRYVRYVRRKDEASRARAERFWNDDRGMGRLTRGELYRVPPRNLTPNNRHDAPGNKEIKELQASIRDTMRIGRALWSSRESRYDVDMLTSHDAFCALLPDIEHLQEVMEMEDLVLVAGRLAHNDLSMNHKWVFERGEALPYTETVAKTLRTGEDESYETVVEGDAPYHCVAIPRCCKRVRGFEREDMVAIGVIATILYELQIAGEENKVVRCDASTMIYFLTPTEIDKSVCGVPFGIMAHARACGIITKKQRSCYVTCWCRTARYERDILTETYDSNLVQFLKKVHIRDGVILVRSMWSNFGLLLFSLVYGFAPSVFDIIVTATTNNCGTDPCLEFQGPIRMVQATYAGIAVSILILGSVLTIMGGKRTYQDVLSFRAPLVNGKQVRDWLQKQNVIRKGKGHEVVPWYECMVSGILDQTANSNGCCVISNNPNGIYTRGLELSVGDCSAINALVATDWIMMPSDTRMICGKVSQTGDGVYHVTWGYDGATSSSKLLPEDVLVSGDPYGTASR